MRAAAQTGARARGPLFIVGAPRSGTTLVRSLLAANPGISIPPESHFVSYLHHRYAGRLDRWRPADSRALARDIADDAHFRDWGLDPDVTTTEVLAANPGSFAETVEQFYLAYARRENKTRWGDKTPHYLFEHETLLRAWPDLLLLNVLRDGRDVASSHLAFTRKGGPWLARSAPSAAIWWKYSLRQARAARARLGSRFAEIRYEDLAAEPGVALRRVCAFAGLEYVDAMLDYTHSARIPSTGPHGAFFARAAEGLQGLARDWRSELTEAEIVAFEAVAGDELAASGYPPSGLVASKRVRVRAMAQAHLFWASRTSSIRVRHALHRYAAPLMRSHQRARPRANPSDQPA